MFSYRHNFSIFELYFGLFCMCINICTKLHLSFRRTWLVQNFRHLTRIYIYLVDYNLLVLSQKKWDWSLWPFSFAIFAISLKKNRGLVQFLACFRQNVLSFTYICRLHIFLANKSLQPTWIDHCLVRMWIWVSCFSYLIW